MTGIARTKNTGKYNMDRCFTLTGYMEDAMHFDSTNVERVEIPDRYEGRVSKGLMVTENSLVTGVWQGRHYPVGRENAKNWGYYSQYTYENQHFVYQKGISDRGPL